MKPAIEILVIEDDMGISTALRDNCKRRGFATRAAFDGQSGLDLIAERLPDLLVLDIMLPLVSGYEICQTLRRQSIEIPILILSAKNREADIVKGLDAGADDYLVKPFGLGEFFARVQALLRRHPKGAQSILELDGSVFNPELAQIKHGELIVSLTQKESGLLRYLASHPEQAIPRARLVQHVWQDDPRVSERSVDRCVTTLRSKLAINPTLQARIQTLRQVGYSFRSIDPNA